MMFVCKDCNGDLISPPDHATFGEAEYCFDAYWWCPKCHHKDSRNAIEMCVSITSTPAVIQWRRRQMTNEQRIKTWVVEWYDDRLGHWFSLAVTGEGKREALLQALEADGQMWEYRQAGVRPLGGRLIGGDK